MKRKILIVILAATFFMPSITKVMATPNEEVLESQQKYDEISQKLDKLTGEIVALNAEIEPLIETIEYNNGEMESITIEVQNTEKEIEIAKEEIYKTQELAGKRIREVYKSGGQSSYMMLLFNANGFNDFIAKFDATRRIVNIDKKIINEVTEKQEKLDNKVENLEERKKELEEVTAETKVVLAQFEEKKANQSKLIDEVAAEREIFERDFLSVAERGLVQYQFSIIDGSSNSKKDLENAISQLRSIRDNQIKSSIVIDEINEKIESAKIQIADIEYAEQLAAEEEALRQQQQQEAEKQPEVESPSTGNSNVPKPQPDNNGSDGGSLGVTGSDVVNYAYGFIGAPYVWGATGPDSFDCSGFTSYVYRHGAGMEITRTTYSQMGVGRAVSYNELQLGDLVFTYGGDHVGIYVGGGSYIHAPQPGDTVRVSPVTSFHSARRVL